MKVKIPREFSIGAVKAHIKYAQNLRNDEGFNGTFNRRTGELQIDPVVVEGARDRIFGHELMEVIKCNYDLDTSEDDMSRIANGWIEFLEQLGIEFNWDDIE